MPEQDWLEVRYEDVIAHPGGQFARMLQFCGLAADGSFERGLRRHTFASGRAEAFRSDLEVTDVRMLSDSLAKHLARFGYPARYGAIIDVAGPGTKVARDWRWRHEEYLGCDLPICVAAGRKWA